MNAIVEVGLPLAIVLAMTIVGLELTAADLQRVLRYPAHIAVALLGQLLLLPALAFGIIALLRPAPEIAGGLILVAAAPQAIISNYFALLGRADVALAVTLTAVTSVSAFVVTPLIVALLFGMLLEQSLGFALPAGKVMQQVVQGLLLPLAAGMAVRRWAPRFVERNRARCQRLSMMALAILLVVVLVSETDSILRNSNVIVLVAASFTIGAAAIGAALARAFSWSREDTVTLLAAFPARSLSVATLVTVNVLGRLEFLSFAVVFFLVQAAILVPLMIWLRPKP